jgi:ribosomal protein S18 acetylase RimI-like enzyme
MSKLLQPLYSTVHYRLMQFPDLDAYIRIHERLAKYDRDGLTIKIAEAADFQQLTKFVDKFRTSTRIADRTGRGDVCVVAYKLGTLAHVRWAALTLRPVWGDYRVHLAPDEAYTYDTHTVPAFRRQGIASEARIFLMTYLAQQGIRCTYGDSRLDNRNTQQFWRKRVRDGRARLLGVIAVATRLGLTHCTFFAETAATRPLIARLFHIPMENVRIRSIDQFLGEDPPAS